MSKRSLFTQITPLPANVSRDTAIQWLHNHTEMIELNPLVLRHKRCDPHETAPQEEQKCHWYEITDQINYLPGGLMKGEVTYKAAFHDLPQGLQTHVYAPAGLHLREKWTICGNMPGEPRGPVELGSGMPTEGLYIREDVDMRCNFLLSSFVKKNLSKSHKVVVERVAEKAASNTIASSTAAARTHYSTGHGKQPSTAGATQLEPHELPTSAQDDLQMELPACQCPDGHLPTCAMYVDPTIGRYTEFHVNHHKMPSRGQVDRIPYEPFNYVKVTTTQANNPELFSGNFHPLSHYQLLLGNGNHGLDEASFVETAKLSLIQAELPTTPH